MPCSSAARMAGLAACFPGIFACLTPEGICSGRIIDISRHLNKSRLRLICNGFVRDRIHEQIRRGLLQQYMPLISQKPATDAGFLYQSALDNRIHRVSAMS